MNNYSKYLISKSLDIDKLINFIKLYPLIKVYYTSITLTSIKKLIKIHNSLRLFPFLKNINIIYSNSISGGIRGIDNSLDKIINYIESRNWKNIIIKIKINSNELFIKDEKYISKIRMDSRSQTHKIFNFLCQNRSQALKIDLSNVDKLYIIVNINRNNDGQFQFLKSKINLKTENFHELEKYEFIPIYSFNNIRYSDLKMISKIINENENQYFTIDRYCGEKYKFNNFTDFNKCINWDLYFQEYTISF